MYLIIGLGNEGREYENTRHNLGFMAVDRLISEFRDNHSWAEELYEKERMDAHIHEFEVVYPGGKHEHLILAKPTTMMNNSGLSVAKLKKAYKAKNDQIILIHDELSVPVGSLKLSVGGSAGGHNGVESVINNLKSEDFVRLRLGIKPLEPRVKMDEFVLQRFRPEEKKMALKTLEMVPVIIKTLVVEGAPKAMTVFNRTTSSTAPNKKA